MKLLCMIICFILVTKQLVLCGYNKDSLHSDKLAGAEEVMSYELEAKS